MPNYCTNLIEVEGPAADIAAFREACLTEDGAPDFDKILPMPAVLQDAHIGTGTAMGWDAELGASALQRTQVVFPFGDPSPIFDRVPIKEAGIQSYEQLESWLRAHRPRALELGANCLEAHRQTGFYVSRDWQSHYWGALHCEPETIREQSETRFAAAFLTPWGPAVGIYHEMARRFPRVAITVSAIERGNELSYRFSSHDGEVKEDEPELTTSFMAHVEGEAEEADDFYLNEAQLQDEPITHPRFWRARARVRQALRSYPVYRPPHDGIEMLMSEADAAANFDYFLSEKAGRIEALRGLLAAFDVQLDHSDTTKHQLDAWLARYGGFLHVRETGSSYLSRRPAWDGPRAGLNVIHDLALFLGEFAIRESPQLRWVMNVDVPEGLQRVSEHFQKPVITGFPDQPRWAFDPLDEVHSICRALRETTYWWRRPMMSVLPRSLYTRFVSKTLLRTRLQAGGDFEAANRAMMEE